MKRGARQLLLNDSTLLLSSFREDYFDKMLKVSKLVLIDGNAILHRAFHALPRFKNKKGEPTGAVHGFVSMLLRVIQDLKPSHIAIAFDRKEPTFRHEEFEQYQAHRPEMDKDLTPQFDKAKAAASAFGIPVYEKAGFEADDVIGTLARQARVDEVVIITGDKDILQLVDKKTKVYLPVRGLSNAVLMGKAEVLEKMGVRPERVDDYKALVGDPSDNYKGVPGVGPKTAVDLLSKYDDLEGVYKNINKIPESLAKKLREGEESARLSFKLAQIVTDVPIKLDLEDAGEWRLDSDEVLDLFAELGFKTLTKRVQKVGAEIAKEGQQRLL